MLGNTISKTEICNRINSLECFYPSPLITFIDKTIYKQLVSIRIHSNTIESNDFDVLKKKFEDIHTTSFSIEARTDKVDKSSYINIQFHIR